MKTSTTTPFQLALQNEIIRLERLSCTDSPSSFSLHPFYANKPTKNKHFLLQFFQHLLSL